MLAVDGQDGLGLPPHLLQAVGQEAEGQPQPGGRSRTLCVAQVGREVANPVQHQGCTEQLLKRLGLGYFLTAEGRLSCPVTFHVC